MLDIATCSTENMQFKSQKLSRFQEKNDASLWVWLQSVRQCPFTQCPTLQWNPANSSVCLVLNKAYNTVYVHPALFSPVILAIPLVSVGLLLANFLLLFCVMKPCATLKWCEPEGSLWWEGFVDQIWALRQEWKSEGIMDDESSNIEKVKVKSDIFHWACSWLKSATDLWLLRRQAYDYLPSCMTSLPSNWYQTVLLGDRGKFV